MFLCLGCQATFCTKLSHMHFGFGLKYYVYFVIDYGLLMLQENTIFKISLMMKYEWKIVCEQILFVLF